MTNFDLVLLLVSAFSQAVKDKACCACEYYKPNTNLKDGLCTHEKVNGLSHLNDSCIYFEIAKSTKEFIQQFEEDQRHDN